MKSPVLGESLTNSVRIGPRYMRTALVFVMLVVPCAMRAQAGPKSHIDPLDQQSPSDFEVASVKRNSSAPSGRMNFKALPGGRLTAENMPLRLLIQHAYGIRAFQISRGPSWIDTERYDIAAKAGREVPERQLVGPMLQKLLEDRFKLRLHRETQQLPVLNLIETPAGAKLTKSNAADCTDREFTASVTPSSLPCHEVVLTISPTGARLRGEQATTAQLVLTLENIIGRPVIDKTALTQNFDVDLEVSLEGLDGIVGFGGGTPATQAADNMTPSILTALPQQLGLRLAPGRGPVEVLVIEHVEKPTGN
jgi:uncharacterized protein (TIGR03435 family)